MIENLSSYTVTIIYTIMMILIVKMIIPDGKNRKYILFVCSLITTIAVIEPLLHILNLDINEVLAQNEIKYEEYKVDDSLYQNAIYESYEKNLVDDVVKRLKENGYNVSNVKVEYDKANYKPVKIYMNLEDEDGYVQPVKVEVSQKGNTSKISEITKTKIQDIIKSNYGIERNNILIERR